MMGYAKFKQLDANDAAAIEINRQYENKELKREKLVAHEIGWNIRAQLPGGPLECGILHIHWAPKDGVATVNTNISAHFKDTHASQKTSGKSNKSEIPRPHDAVLYNRFVILNAKWASEASARWTRPTNAELGWTSLKSARITKDMVDNFRQANNDAALFDLARNNLYKTSTWDHESWNSYMWWMATGGA